MINDSKLKNPTFHEPENLPSIHKKLGRYNEFTKKFLYHIKDLNEMEEAINYVRAFD